MHPTAAPLARTHDATAVVIIQRDRETAATVDNSFADELVLQSQRLLVVNVCSGYCCSNTA